MVDSFQVSVYAPDLDQDRLDAPQRCVKSILSEWKKYSDIDVTILTHEEKNNGVYSIGQASIPEQPLKKTRAISDLDPDVVYTFRPRDILFPILIDTPVLLTYHGDVQVVEPALNYGPYPRLFSLKQRIMEVPQLPQYDGIVCVSKDLAERVRERPFQPPVWHVHNGVDLNRFTPTASCDLEVPNQYVLHLSAFSRRKNPEGVIRAFSQIENNEDMKLVIAGGGWKSESEIRSLIDRLDLEDQVTFLGYVSDDAVPGLYADASAFLFPSYHECFGLPVLEAMACGTPVVASTAYSLPEIVGDAGFLADPDDYETLGDHLSKIIRNPNIQADYSEKGRLQAKKFTWDKTAKELKEILRSVIQNGK